MNLIGGLIAIVVGVVFGMLLRALRPVDPATAVSAATRPHRRTLRMAGAWTAAITLVGLGAAVVPTTPYWLAGFVLAGGYAALAVTVVWRLVGLDRREVETVRRRFEEIVAPLRNEMPR